MEDTNFISEEIMEKIMTGVAVAGTAKSLGKEALIKLIKESLKKLEPFFLKQKKHLLKFMDAILNLSKKKLLEKKLIFVFY